MAAIVSGCRSPTPHSGTPDLRARPVVGGPSGADSVGGGSPTLGPTVPPAPTPSPRRTTPPAPAGHRLAAASLAAVMALAVCACGTAASPPGHGDTRTVSRVGSATHDPTTPAERAAAVTARSTFRDDIGNASSAFVADVAHLQGDLQAGDVAAARSDELAAQVQFDQFRQLAGGDPINASTVDELATQVGPGQSFGGLHAVERDLWSVPGGDVGAALSDASGLEAQAPVAEFLLSKDAPAPEAIGVLGVDDLNWLVDQAVTEDQERYSHLDAVDIAATADAADTAVSAIAPLDHLVDPTLAAEVAERCTALLADVAALGPPTQVTDGQLGAPQLLALSRQADAAAADLARLSADLVPFGTGGDGDP
jgi:iron uptake system EfeUOB component EfeO/EfeM